jgi:hypothetical protein
MKKKINYSDRDLLLDLDIDFVKVVQNSKEPVNILQIKKNSKNLNGEQQKFNKLIKQIEKLEKKVENTKALANELNIIYSKQIAPIETELGHAYFRFAQYLDGYAAKLKLTDNQRSELEENIVKLCDNALIYIEPDEQQEALFNKYNDFSYREAVEDKKRILIDEFRTMMEEEMGIEMDDMNFDISDEAEARKYGEKLKEKFQQKKDKEEEDELKKIKTKQQIEEEQKQKLQEELTNKSLRSIYISLAKMLHPDTEPDEELKVEKSELMKKVTVAYNEKDLATLLKLEMEWVHHTTENLGKISDDILKLYNNVLKEQVMELNDELYFTNINPSYAKIFKWLNYSKSYAHKSINIFKDELIDELEEIKNHEKSFEKQPVKKYVLVKYLKETKENDDDDDDDSFGAFLDLMYKF